jgi:hypothetical protein
MGIIKTQIPLNPSRATEDSRTNLFIKQTQIERLSKNKTSLKTQQKLYKLNNN